MKQTVPEDCLKTSVGSETSASGDNFDLFRLAEDDILFRFEELFYVTLTTKVKRVDHDQFYNAIKAQWQLIIPGKIIYY